MNEFLEQFLAESRELVEQATDDLLALEECADDRERLDSAFRAFHTLKGAAGIMDFDAMGRALHAAEDLLSAARAGEQPVTPTLISDGLTCLDQVVQWLDAMEASGGETPPGADAAADALVRRLARDVVDSPPPSPPSDWSDALLARHPQAAARAAVGLRYAPAMDSFFNGQDPLAVVRGMPGLCALEIEPSAPWPPLESFDPFASQLTILALFETATADLLGQIAALGSQAVLVHLSPTLPQAVSGLAELGAELVHAQILMLQATAQEGAAGRIGSAVRVVSNILRREARAADADRLEQLARADTTNAAPLIEAFQKVLAGDALGEDASDTAPRLPQEPTARGLRVDVERVDALVNLTGELTVAKNALAHAANLAASGGDPQALASLLKGQYAHLDRLVGELQRSVLNMRVLPLRHVFQRFPRLVREMVIALDKPVRLVTIGDATEADKTIVENLFEPVLHILRNAVDHGVEPTAQRTAAGKAPSAVVELRARREGDHVVIEIEDDGRGIDVTRVREVALRRGVVSAEALAELSDDEAKALIFAPGFSTAEGVTQISGRGVGMDAVRATVERLGGRVSIESEQGLGTLVRLTLPFTVMMTRVMTVEAGGQVFGIPMDAILETVRLPRDAVIAVGTAQAFVLRNRTVPLIDLAHTLGRAAVQRDGEASVVVVSAAGQIGGLEVDRLGDRLDVMLKPLGGLLSGMPGVAGTTLLGDGRVLLVLDLQELLQ